MAGSGSALYVLTWKAWDMPAGPPFSALRAVGAQHIRQRLFWVAVKARNQRESVRWIRPKSREGAWNRTINIPCAGSQTSEP